MKVIKLTATARADIELWREGRNPRYPNPAHYVLAKGPSLGDGLDKWLADTELWTKSLTDPTVIHLDEYPEVYEHLRRHVEGTLFLYQDCFYDVIGELREDQKRLLVLESADEERQLFERLKAKFDSPESRSIKPKRERIPEAVRIAVWRRDEGRCARCGSRDRLEYDHIVPVDRGGSSTVRNVELLCEACNRAKSNNIE